MVPIGECVGGLQISVRFLGGENLRNPIFHRLLHLLLRLDDVRVPLRIHHQRDANGLDGLVHPRVGEHVTLLASVRLPAQRLGSFDEIVNATLTFRQVGAVDVVNAVRDPVHDKRLGPGAPQRAVNLVTLRINHVEPLRRRRGRHLHAQRG